jgi:hypothetical protein
MRRGTPHERRSLEPRAWRPAVIGLIYLVAFAVYLLVAFLIVRATVRWAKRTGRSPTTWGWGSALAIYLLVFWDHLPTLIAHEVLCRTVPDVKIYKTFEQWKAEHPGEARPVAIAPGGGFQKDREGRYVSMANSRFGIRTVSTRIGPLSTSITREQIIDLPTEEVLVERVMTGSGYGSLGASSSWQAMKIWLNLDGCVPDSMRFHAEAKMFASSHRQP